MLASTPPSEYISDWSRDAKYIVYQLNTETSGRNLWYLERSDDGGGWEPHEFLKTSFVERAPKLSPDGRFIAYVSDGLGPQRALCTAFSRGRTEDDCVE